MYPCLNVSCYIVAYKGCVNSSIGNVLSFHFERIYLNIAGRQRIYPQPMTICKHSKLADHFKTVPSCFKRGMARLIHSCILSLY